LDIAKLASEPHGNEEPEMRKNRLQAAARAS